MKTVLTALATAGLLVLSACGGGANEAEANNAAAASDDLALPPENGTDPLATGGADTLENQAGALGSGDLTGNGADLNSTDAAANATADGSSNAQ